MRFETSRYPVDRYLVENSKTVEMVNIIDDEIWNSEPVMRPEDEIILKKLHDMLQSTADDLKVLSGELSKINQPGVKVKSQPAPLDEEFNEKVHIEEIVNAKFHGHKIVEKPLPFLPEFKPNKDVVIDMLGSKNQNHEAINKHLQTNSTPSNKTKINKNLKMTRLKAVHINEYNNISNNVKIKKIPTVSYDEMIHKNMEEHQKEENTKEKQLQIQIMPSINIRSEMKEQRVFQLDILPETIEKPKTNTKDINNIGVIEIMYSQIPHETVQNKTTVVTSKNHQNSTQLVNNSKFKSNRKIYKMSTYESSESTNNLSSDAHQKIHIKKQIKLSRKPSPKQTGSANIQNKKNVVNKRSHLNLDEWKKKLNSIYGQPSSSRSRGTTLKSRKFSPKKSNILKSNSKSSTLNNGEYIPYNKLTLGGVRVSDIEREISEISNKNDLPLSPILDKILSSRENSFHIDSPKKRKNKHTPKILSTSDENLLQEVMDIEKTVSETLSKDFKHTMKNTNLNHQNGNLDNDDSNDSYADDFEDEKSEGTASSKHDQDLGSDNSDVFIEQNNEANDNKIIRGELSNTHTQEENLKNMTFTKDSNLSFKDSVDIFEYIHSVDTQEMGTQSNSASKISRKETQTSPRNGNMNIEPICNDLISSIDPRGEIESLFQLEKEFIKKLIIDEYGQIIENNIMKPSSSKKKDDEDMKNNVAAFQKNTQTSPARVKNAMTSPTKTKTRTTSPFSLSLTVDRQTSPILLTNNEELKIIIDNEPDDLGISINLSSPRFSLRLPQNSREVLSNLDNYSGIGNSKSIIDLGNVSKAKQQSRNAGSSSSSVDADNSSSEISSLGEVKLKLKRKFRKTQILSLSETSSASIVSQTSSDVISGEILPLKSEGELSLGQTNKKSSKNRHKNSEGEMNVDTM
ncbi:unnamed protein product [Chilo suppressalis]|uniref:Uncharacterized protein n=1 Tax=Chilo suppressalis TaxID=168631 RepID=A0ABN8AXQ8_CHISP|nr:unnamed protein product [Chilo suppressalis]